MNAPFVAHVTLNDNDPLDANVFPGNLAFTKNLHLEFDSPVTFFVGENGSGKSTLLEAMAVLARLPIGGGGTNELGANYAFSERSSLANSLRLAFLRQPADRYFFRAETQAHFASLLEQRRDDPDFRAAGVRLVSRAVRWTVGARMWVEYHDSRQPRVFAGDQFKGHAAGERRV